MVQQDCPNNHAIEQFLLGRLAADEVTQLEVHLAQCDRCVETAHNIVAEDTLVEAMRAEETTADSHDPTTVTELIDRVRALRRAQGGSVDETQSSTPSEFETTMGIETDELGDSVAPLEAGDELSGYQIVRVLGKGGMGIVYEAKDLKLKRRVALKVMKPALAANRLARERFTREAQAMAAIEHDHIVPIYQVDEDRGIPFFAMQFLQGESLKSRLAREKKLPLADILRIGREVAGGLAAAHERGLLHRDITPGNVFLVSRGVIDGESDSPFPANHLTSYQSPRVKILDFGLARSADDDSSLTLSGVIVGTPKFMSPEQTQGQVVDHRSDLFSLGSVLYRLITGELPFVGPTVLHILAAISETNPIPPSALNPDIPAALSELIMKLLEKDASQRIQSAHEVVETIKAIEQGLSESEIRQPVRREQPRHLPNGGRFQRPRFLAIAGAFLAAFVLLGAIVIFQTAEGTVEVTSADGKLPPDIQVSVMTEDGQPILVIVSNDQWRASLKNGRYKLELRGPSRDQFELNDQSLVVRRFGKSVVKITQKSTEPSDSDRVIAEWILARGGTVGIQYIDEYPKIISPRDKLREVKFKLVQVTQYYQPEITGDDLRRLVALTHLERLHTGGALISDDDLAPIANLTTLTRLLLHNTQITNNGLTHLSRLTKLEHLSLHDARRVTDDGLKHLKGLTNLRDLNLAGTNVTAEGMRHLAGMSELESIYTGIGVTDRFMDFLGLWQSLKQIRFDQAAITDSGLSKLASAIPLEILELRHCANIGDEGLKAASKISGLKELVVFGVPQVTDVGLSHLLKASDLELLEIDLQNMTNQGLVHIGKMNQLKRLKIQSPQITDAGLQHLAGLKTLEQLDLTPSSQGDFKITAAGVARLQAELPDTKIIFNVKEK